MSGFEQLILESRNLERFVGRCSQLNIESLQEVHHGSNKNPLEARPNKVSVMLEHYKKNQSVDRTMRSHNTNKTKSKV